MAQLVRDNFDTVFGALLYESCDFSWLDHLALVFQAHKLSSAESPLVCDPEVQKVKS